MVRAGFLIYENISTLFSSYPTCHMMVPESSSSSWTRILLGSSSETETGGSSVNQPEARHPANAGAGGQEAGPSLPVVPYPYQPDEVIGGDAGRGASCSTEPGIPDLNIPASEEDPGDRSGIERALDQLELAKIQEKKDRLAEQISPLIESEKARLNRRFWHRNFGHLPSPNEMVEIIIDRFASEGARNANKPYVPRANLRHLKVWLTRAQQSAEQDGKGNMSIRNMISKIIEESFK